MDIFGGILDFVGGLMTNDANEDIAAQNRQFQHNESSTAYQRAVADMQAAGLNPMLAYSQGGASTPGGAMATMQNALGSGVNTAYAGTRLEQDLANLRAQERQTDAQTGKVVEEQRQVAADTALKDSQALVNAAMIPKIAAETKQSVSSAAQLDQAANRIVAELSEGLPGAQASQARAGAAEAAARVKSGLYPAQAYSARQAGRHAGAQVPVEFERAKLYGAEAVLRELDRNRGTAYSDFYGTRWGRTTPYIDSAGSAVNSAASAAAKFKMFRSPGRGQGTLQLEDFVR